VVEFRAVFKLSNTLKDFSEITQHLLVKVHLQNFIVLLHFVSAWSVVVVKLCTFIFFESIWSWHPFYYIKYIVGLCHQNKQKNRMSEPMISQNIAETEGKINQNVASEDSGDEAKRIHEDKMKYYNNYNNNNDENSSDEDRPVFSSSNNQTDEEELESNAETNEYAMIGDDFGEFVSAEVHEDFVSENVFADFSQPIGRFRGQETAEEKVSLTCDIS
jgi:hypothetical protein